MQYLTSVTCSTNVNQSLTSIPPCNNEVAKMLPLKDQLVADAGEVNTKLESLKAIKPQLVGGIEVQITPA